MASGEKQSNASLYSTLSSVQYKAGCSFVETLELKLGDKVLDMGCGTGELTTYIAKQVGELGKVIGVDPDHARVQLSQENMKMVSNASFHVGNSESGFLNYYQAYFDLHYSNHVYHWLSNEEKAVYIKVAFQSLKPGGLIAVQCLAQPDDDIDNRLIESALGKSVSSKIHFAEGSSSKELLRDVGFTEVDVRIIPSVTYYSSFKVYAESFLAAGYTDIEELPDKKLLEEFQLKSIEKDGRVKSKYNLIQIKGRKS
ncbi:Hypothetical predicted protein [Paramuricea clavata]|uniref:Methyltransferase domain-containing protein n=1 Tax=Paramuricea clavata TaxID=317549 RepID=A0A7D9IPB1_PARCT|nr:Hypothetical predicted protein [Paramuricea clavata]